MKASFHDQALLHLNESLDVLRNIHGDRKHPMVGQVLALMQECVDKITNSEPESVDGVYD